MFRKNTAGQFIHFQGVTATTGGILTGATFTARRCIDGTFAAATGTVTEDTGIGFYKFAMSQADTNGNNIGFNFTASLAVPQTVNIVTTVLDPTSAAFGLVLAKTTNLTGLNDIAATDIVSAGAITTLSGAVVNVDTVDLCATTTTATTATNLTNAPTNGDLTAVMKTSVTTAATAATPTAAAVTGAVGSVTGAVGSVTGNVGGNVVGSVASVTAAVTVGTINANVVNASALAADAVAEIADGVWDEALAGHLGAGSTGEQLNAAGAAGDPWSTALPGAYGAGTAGKIVGDNVNAAITSRMATYVQPTGFLAASFPSDPADQSLVIAATDAIIARGDAAWITAAGFATPTNITAATGIVLSGVTHTGAVIPTVSAVTGLTASDVGAIKTKTDSLNFTVAGKLDANVLVVNGVTVTGVGSPAVPWGPA